MCARRGCAQGRQSCFEGSPCRAAVEGIAASAPTGGQQIAERVGLADMMRDQLSARRYRLHPRSAMATSLPFPADGSSAAVRRSPSATLAPSTPTLRTSGRCRGRRPRCCAVRAVHRLPAETHARGLDARMAGQRLAKLAPGVVHRSGCERSREDGKSPASPAIAHAGGAYGRFRRPAVSHRVSPASPAWRTQLDPRLLCVVSRSIPISCPFGP